jgi:hypothetical protein
MAMPRPSGRAQKIAQQVVPGLSRHIRRRQKQPTGTRGEMSEVEVIQTNMIEDREGLR